MTLSPSAPAGAALARRATGREKVRPEIAARLRDLAREGLAAAVDGRPPGQPVDLAPLHELIDTIRLTGRRRRRAEAWLREPLRLSGSGSTPSGWSEIERLVADGLRPPVWSERLIRRLWPEHGVAGRAPLSAGTVLAASAHVGWSEPAFRIATLRIVQDRLSREVVFYPAVPEIDPPGRRVLWIAAAHAVAGAAGQQTAARAALAATLVEFTPREPVGGALDPWLLTLLAEAGQGWPDAARARLEAIRAAMLAAMELSPAPDGGEGDRHRGAEDSGPAEDGVVTAPAFLPGDAPIEGILHRLLAKRI